MSDQSSPAAELSAYRQILVEERRKIVRTALRSDETGMLPVGGVPNLKAVQDLIEAVDRAIVDEQKLQPSDFEADV